MTATEEEEEERKEEEEEEMKEEVEEEEVSTSRFMKRRPIRCTWMVPKDEDEGSWRSLETPRKRSFPISRCRSKSPWDPGPLPYYRHRSCGV